VALLFSSNEMRVSVADILKTSGRLYGRFSNHMANGLSDWIGLQRIRKHAGVDTGTTKTAHTQAVVHTAGYDLRRRLGLPHTWAILTYELALFDRIRKHSYVELLSFFLPSSQQAVSILRSTGPAQIRG
jgi:hypothetical protein